MVTCQWQIRTKADSKTEEGELRSAHRHVAGPQVARCPEITFLQEAGKMKTKVIKETGNLFSHSATTSRVPRAHQALC